MIGTNNRQMNSNRRMSKAEFLCLIPNLSIEDALLTEYRIGTKWNPLVVAKDENRRLFQCCLCNVVQSGQKNMFAHLAGKKHNLKVQSIDQIHQPKYLNTKDNGAQITNGNANTDCKETACAVIDVDNLPTEVGEKASPEIVKNADKIKKNETHIDDINTSITTDISTDVKNSDEALTRQRNTENKVRVDDETDENGRVQEHYQPPTKKSKMVINPAAIVKGKTANTSTESPSQNDEKVRYSTNIIITPTKNKVASQDNINRQLKPAEKSKPAEQSKPASGQVFSTKRIGFNSTNTDILGLIGVEYVVKIMRGRNDNDPKYECSLCEDVNYGLGMQNHILSYSHRLRFCEKHFPTAIRQYKQYIRNVKPADMHKVMTPILHKLALAIESHHGRDLPFECLADEFNANRHEIFSRAFSCRHASEQYGPTFTHIVTSREVDQLIAEIEKFREPHFPQHVAFDARLNKTGFDCPLPFNRNQNIYNSYAHPRATNPGGGGDSGSGQIMYPAINAARAASMNNVAGNRMPMNRTYNIPPAVNQTSYANNSWRQPHPSSMPRVDIWQKYQQIVDQKIMDLNNEFQYYRADPERHPAYNDEWQAFWKRRKNELFEIGVDHRTYDYQPEWVKFFNLRIEELYFQSLEKIKIQVREMLGLPKTNEHLTDKRYHVNADAVDYDLSNKNPTNQPKNVSNKKNQSKFKHPTVAVIRSLTNFAKYLGSLGPKIFELFCEALSLESKNPNQLDATILNRKNCALLETAMEKFKGQIIADMIDQGDIGPLSVAIQSIEALLLRAPHSSRRESHSAPTTANYGAGLEGILSHSMSQLVDSTYSAAYSSGNSNHQQQQRNSSLANVDKKELSLKLANMLAAQGKTVIDPAQLQKIISVYMMIEEKKNNILSNIK